MDFPVNKLLVPPADWPPTLTVVIDTEEEFDWSAPFDRQSTATENISRQGLAQAIFDRHGVVPAYVIDYPVASSPEARSVLAPIRTEGRCEIGAHLHPWVNPPHEEVVDNFHSYPGNLAPELEKRKLGILASSIEEGFGQRPTIYKAGRYGIGPATAATLVELGFKADVSVVPHTSFRQSQGPDFNEFPDIPFETEGSLIALPLSVGFVGSLAFAGPSIYPRLSGRGGMRLHFPGIFSRLRLLERLRLSPEGHSLNDMIRQTEAAMAEGQRFFMLTYHSSSLLPGAAPYVRNDSDLVAFLATLDGYLSFFLGAAGGRSLSISQAACAMSEL